MNQSDDGHDTQCSFRKCAHPESPNPCPFVQDDKPVTLSRPSDHYFKDCRHEWRQRFEIERGRHSLEPAGFYCVFCLKIQKT